ncbi:alpha-L-fucosidase [candidate division KSB1 bacterium]|nr:alpha-L-fucosidase [candidate division KSB1 bacterium]
MKNTSILILFVLTWSFLSPAQAQSQAEKDTRMRWWREARFGLFIHWGLYAIPAGEWEGVTTYGEWIRHSAKIPLPVYDRFIAQFNPTLFDADAWVRMAKGAGMKYIVITSKHHDGFCLFDSKYTDFDVMSTPFKRDILKELAAACGKHGIRLCFYHSIMDWHHPDYLPRREWETDRPGEGADYDRYYRYMKDQLKELLTNYGDIGVLWFDGEWESTWNSRYGWETYQYVRGLQPDIIINNRVGAGRAGMEGFTIAGEFSGDFGTPEQEIPATGLPGRDWETCMTMNDHWGYNKHNHNYKSTKQLIRNLVDIASKGGNFLLNVGPTAEGLFPQASIEHLQQMGEWMAVNGEAIYATRASPFKHLDWGRCTIKESDKSTRLYLHVFDWPVDGKLVVTNIYNQPDRAVLLAQSERALEVEQTGEEIIIRLPEEAPDPYDSVVALDVDGKADIGNPPEILTEFDIFIDSLKVEFAAERENVAFRYTVDGTNPTAGSHLYARPIFINQSATVRVRCFRDAKPVSGVAAKTFARVEPRSAQLLKNARPGLRYRYFEGEWDALPAFAQMDALKSGVAPNFTFSPRRQEERFGFEYTGYIRIPEDGMYIFYTASDDGSRLYIGDELVVDNDLLHGVLERRGVIALSEGFHPIRVIYFEKTGGDALKVSVQKAGMPKLLVPDDWLWHGEE